MRLVKMPAMSLQPGMFVAELDRPWLETPFSLQGFVIQNTSEVLYVSKYVEHVFVDAEYSGRPVFLNLALEPTAGEGKKRLEIKEDLAHARICFDNAANTLDKVYESLRSGRTGDIETVQESITPLIESVFNNKEAVAALLRLRESDDYRYQHGISMAVWAAILGRQIGLHRDELETLALGCAMCDVGMTQLPADLLSQPQALSDQQLRIIHAHPKMGAELVAKNSDVSIEVLAIVENHHERVDGSGYPRGMEGSSIPVLARIAGLVDAYDAMITPRPYAPARTSHEAIQELMDGKGTLFQESLVEQFIQAIGLFPTGTLVELNSGEVGIVTRQNDTRRLKPEIIIVLDEEQKERDPCIVDLSLQDTGSERWITRELLPGSYGLDSEEYFI
ncbi:HD-GYP domain-containing protein [Halioglobus maricola]|uniref:HD-GYP domain-containing protein n=1 Tax=Halioglobus maricola TaxID=2601894 RepID=A0A5P9NGX3_9GAMM|nr:HD-GYP domain-containing protein [Halioglobus maricola]QFU74278.1 HD-GYP domain-containing protein [Halioglobus maricola]